MRTEVLYAGKCRHVKTIHNVEKAKKVVKILVAYERNAAAGKVSELYAREVGMPIRDERDRKRGCVKR